MPVGTAVGPGPDDIVLDGYPAPPPQEGGVATIPILCHVCCGQTVVWIKMALGIEVGLDPGHHALDGDTAPLP